MRTPILIPRWVLALKYGLFILLGVAIWRTTSPSFVQVVGDWYTTAWSWCLIAGAVVALLGSLREKTEKVERVGASALACLLLAYAVAPLNLVLRGDPDRTATSVVALIVSLLPLARSLQLWIGKGHRA
jgi:hypothetical protein